MEGAIHEDILRIAAQFETPLKLQGMVATELDLVKEWHDTVQYALYYLKPQATIIAQPGSSCFTRQRPTNGLTFFC